MNSKPVYIAAMCFVAFVLWEVIGHPLLRHAMGGHCWQFEGAALGLGALGTAVAVLTMRRQLRQCQILHRVKDDLTHMIVHDMNNPLQSVLGYADLLAAGYGGTLSSEQAEYVSHIRTQGSELAMMMQNLLDISKLEAGRMKVHREPLNITDVVASALSAMEALAAKQGVQLTEACDVDCPLVEADAALLKRILLNLLSNAIKFSPIGGTVQVAAYRAYNAAELIVAVSDEGPGIPPAMHEKIFEKFVQMEGEPQKGKNGTGLGLTFCQMAVEAHGGRIWVESEVGKGSVFFFTIPVMKQHGFFSLTTIHAPKHENGAGGFTKVRGEKIHFGTDGADERR